MDREHKKRRLKLLVDRLERISADSTWAHQASGLRGSLLLILDQLNRGESVSSEKADPLVIQGYDILVHAMEIQKKANPKKTQP